MPMKEIPLEVDDEDELTEEEDKTVEAALDAFDKMSDKVRVAAFEAIMATYCYRCGTDQPDDPEEECSCEEDEEPDEEDEDESDDEDDESDDEEEDEDESD